MQIRPLIGKTSKNPTMLHGTSIEAVFELENKGKLMPSVPYGGDHLIPDPHRNRLYFEKPTPLINGRPAPRNYPATVYAKMNAFTGYFANEINCKKATTYHLIKELESGLHSFVEFKSLLDKEEINIPLEHIESLYDEGKKREGAVIEPHESILGLDHGKCWDDTDDMYVMCPNGLPIKHISAIELMGPVEKELMKKFLDGELEYEGFRID